MRAAGLCQKVVICKRFYDKKLQIFIKFMIVTWGSCLNKFSFLSLGLSDESATYLGRLKRPWRSIEDAIVKPPTLKDLFFTGLGGSKQNLISVVW